MELARASQYGMSATAVWKKRDSKFSFCPGLTRLVARTWILKVRWPLAGSGVSGQVSRVPLIRGTLAEAQAALMLLPFWDPLLLLAGRMRGKTVEPMKERPSGRS